MATRNSDQELGVTICRLSRCINKYTKYRVNRLVNEFEPLNGQAPDDYLATRAVADERSQRCRTYLATLNRTGAVIGYFTLAVGSLVVPEDNRMSPSMKSMIRVDSGIAQSFLLEHVSRSKGTPKGFGSDLVDVAIAHVLQANAEVGCAMLRLECEEGLVDYYAEKGFALISDRKDDMNSMMLLLSPPESSSEPALP